MGSVTHAGTELATKGPQSIAGGEAKAKSKKRRILLTVALLLSVAIMVRLSSRLTNAMRAKNANAKSPNDKTKDATDSPAAPAETPQPSAARAVPSTPSAHPPPVPEPVRHTENTNDRQEPSATNRVRQQVAEEQPKTPATNGRPIKKQEGETVSADEYFMPI
jgi:uncharacterized membrane protein